MAWIRPVGPLATKPWPVWAGSVCLRDRRLFIGAILKFVRILSESMDINEAYDLLVSNGIRAEDAEKIRGKYYLCRINGSVLGGNLRFYPRVDTINRWLYSKLALHYR